MSKPDEFIGEVVLEHDNVVLFCKTYSGDLEYFQVLYNSIQKHNKDNIEFYVSVPEKEKSLFDKFENITLISDQDLGIGIPNSWHQQQVIKLAFHKICPTDYYVVLDSDSEFLTDFYVSDFIEDNIPKFVMHDNEDLFSWYREKGHLRDSLVGVARFDFDPRVSHFKQNWAIHEELAYTGKVMHYSSPFMFSKEVVEFLDYNLGIVEMIQQEASELMWHGVGVRKYAEMVEEFEYEPVPSLFKIYHYKEQWDDEFISNEDIIKQGFKGKIEQSNWKRFL